MHRRNEYKHLAHNTRKRAWEEKNAQLRAQVRSVGSYANRAALKLHLDLSLNLRAVDAESDRYCFTVSAR